MTTEQEIRNHYDIPLRSHSPQIDRFIKQQLEANKRAASTPSLLDPAPHFVASTPTPRKEISPTSRQP